MTALRVTCLLAFAAAALCQEPAPGAQGPFIAISPSAESPIGGLRGLRGDGSINLLTADGLVAVRDLISLRQPDVPLPPLPTGPQLIMTTGDRIAGRLVSGDGSALRFRPDFTKVEWSVPVASARVVWLAPEPADTPPDPARYSWLDGKLRRDLFRFRNGDRATGTYDGFAAGELRFKPDGGETRLVPLSQLSAVAFNPALASARRPKGLAFHLILKDGSRLDVTGPEIESGKLRARALFGQQIEVPLADLVGLDVIGGKATPLSGLKPAKVEEAGFLGSVWHWTADRSVRGQPLRLRTDRGVENYDRGLGTHPRTFLTYRLDGKYRRFEALVGLDPDSGKRGSAVVRILLDGKERPIPDLLKLTAAKPVPVRIDVTGAKTLILSIDFGPAGGVAADVNWTEARLVE